MVDLVSSAAGETRVTTSTLRTADGLELAFRHHQRTAADAEVVILHGYAEHMGRYDALVSTLVAAGFDCLLLDLRGHGHSGGTRGYVGDFDRYLQDLDLVLDKVPLTSRWRILLGHSLGGLISVRYVLRCPAAFDALALSSPYLAPASKIPEWRVLGAVIAAHLVPKLGIPDALDPDGLTHDRRKVRQYVDDPLVFRSVNTRWFVEVREAQRDICQRAGKIELPTLLMIGGDDPVASPSANQRWFQQLGSSDKTLRVYPGMLHEVFNELGHGVVFTDLVAWLTAGSPPSAAG